MATKPTNKPKNTDGKPTAGTKSTNASFKPKAKKPTRWFGAVGIFAALWVLVGLYFLVLAGGKSDQKAIATLNTDDFHSLAFSPTEPDTVFFGSHSGLLKSTNGGRSWQPTRLNNQDAMSQGISQDGKLFYIGGHNVFSKSEDGGQSWRSLVDKLPGSDIHALTIDPANSLSIFAYAVGVGLLGSQDGGQSWQTVSNQPGNGTVSLAYGNATLWAAVINQGVLRSQDGGRTWQAASGFANGALNSNTRLTALAYDKTTGMLYAGSTDGLYNSMDGGSSWNRSNYSGSVAALAISPLNPKILLLVNTQGGVFRSEDTGVSWASK